MIRAENIGKKYRAGSQDIHVLNGVNLEIKENEFAAIMGKSGSGKSTLLHLLGCLDYPDEGIYYFDGRDMLSASDDERAKVRSEKIGFVFQSFNLIPELTIVENVSLPFTYRNDNKKKVDFLVRQAIDQVGLSGRLDHRMNEISGGELQRVAIARALAIQPKLILADEPTGNLDHENTHDILSLFKELHSISKTSLLIITHDAEVAAFAENIYYLANGKLHNHRV